MVLLKGKLEKYRPHAAIQQPTGRGIETQAARPPSTTRYPRAQRFVLYPKDLGRSLAKVSCRCARRKLARRILCLGLRRGYRESAERAYQQVPYMGFNARPAGRRCNERPHQERRQPVRESCIPIRFLERRVYEAPATATRYYKRPRKAPKAGDIHQSAVC